MELTHRFTVPTPVEETWAHFEDIAAVGECFPGATVTSAEADSFAGSVKVKLGPIALLYNGTGTFTAKDEAAHTFTVEAKGKDKRGNGTAGATVDLSMRSSGGGTEVEVLTDLSVTGKPAQFGRGVMQDVSDKLLGQFVDCLEQRLSSPQERADPALESELEAEAKTATEPQVEAMASAPDEASSARHSPPATPSSGATGQDSLDLGATVLPILAKTYGKPLAALVVVLLLIVWVRRRR